jgi:signal transduction histidine kinase
MHAAQIEIERLKRSDLFAELTDAELAEVAQFCREETHQENDVLLTEDAPAERLYLVEQGKLALEKKIQLGKRATARAATVGYVEPGSVAGWSALVRPYLYTSTALCLEPTRVIAIDGVRLREYLQQHPAVGFKVLGMLVSLVATRYRSAMDTLTYFLSIVSHELRAPLAAIENYLQVMLDGLAGELTDKQQHMLKRSSLRVKDLRSLIGDLVDLARMRPEQIQADFEWFDPGEVGTESYEDVRLAAAEKNIKIKIVPPPRFEKIVGARRRMRQVFTNLLSNAVKFSPEGSTVTFRAWYEADALYFQVEDEGVGIPPEDLPHIFEDFYRADNVGDAPGTGLGLSLAKKIMDAHGGAIRVTSPYAEDKTGAQFTVVIPRNLQTPAMRRQQWAAENAIRET